jgi:cobalt-zinc-cadmium efflux system outer membrane protein
VAVAYNSFTPFVIKISYQYLSLRTFMDSNFPVGERSRWAIVPVLALALIPLSACQTGRIDPAAEAAVSKATGLSQAVTFRIEGASVDEPSAGEALTFADATRRAVATSPKLQAALARVRIAMADADQARLLPNPVLNFILRFGSGSPQVEVSLTQEFIHVLQIPRRASAADNRLRQAAADAVTVALDVVADVQERYAESQVAGRLVMHYQGRLELLGRLTQVVRLRLEAGEGVVNDVTVLESQRVELEVRLDEAEHVERSERLKLARLIGEPTGSAAWKLDDWIPPQPTMTTENDWIRVALVHRPEVQSITWKLAALGDEYALARLLPWQGAGVGIDAQKSPDWFAGPSISTPIPVFDMGQARQARVTAEQIEARHELTSAQRQVVEDVRLAHLALVESLRHLARVREELVPLLERRREQAEKSYRGGQTDVTALYLAQQDLRAAETLAIEFERETSSAIIRLQRAVGGPGIASEVMHSTPSPNSVGSPTPSAAERR